MTHCPGCDNPLCPGPERDAEQAAGKAEEVTDAQVKAACDVLSSTPSLGVHRKTWEETVRNAIKAALKERTP